MTGAERVSPQDLVERALAAAGGDAVVVVEETSTTNLRWAANSLTTNGATRSRSVSAVRLLPGADGVRAGVVSASASRLEDVDDLVRAARVAAEQSTPADDAAELVPARQSADWDHPVQETGPASLEAYVATLGRALRTARGQGRDTYGYAEHEVTTTYLGTSTGLRLRHAQPTGRVEVTARLDGGARSAWVGRHTRDFTDVDAEALDAELATRLGWARRSIDVAPGRHDVVLPPGAVADLLVYAYWKMAARSAAEGSTAFSRAGGGTRVGERLATLPLTLDSDPMLPGLECAPFVVATAGGPASSVFDNGLPIGPTAWVEDGELRALLQTRASAARTGLAVTPAVDNLRLLLPDATTAPEQLHAGVERGLLVTTLWYIREVDPETLLLTGLTRDGVYVVEDGEVVGQATNFRFNESPLSLLERATEASATVPVLCREWSDYFRRTAMPALRVPDFHMSTVSDAR